MIHELFTNRASMRLCARASPRHVERSRDARETPHPTTSRIRAGQLRSGLCLQEGPSVLETIIQVSLAMSLYLTIPGCNALSDFREEQLRIATGAQAIRAVWVHYVQPQEEPSLQTQQALERLLQYGQPFDKEDQYARGLLGIVQRKPMFDGRSQVFFVLPRPGWVSPWSSQATSFTHGTSLGKQVKRIERGMAIMVTKSQQWDDVKQLPLANLFHDRMTQVGALSPLTFSLLTMDRDR